MKQLFDFINKYSNNGNDLSIGPAPYHGDGRRRLFVRRFLLYSVAVSSGLFSYIIALLGVSMFVYIGAYSPARKKLELSRIKETKFFDRLDDVLAGFKEIRINYQKNEELFGDLDLASEDGVLNALEFETMDSRGAIKGIWMEYIDYALSRVNSQETKNIILYLSKHRNREVDRGEL